MDDQKMAIAKTCLEGAEENTITFPQIVGALMAAGFESYEINFRRATAIYYLPDGGSVELATHKVDAAIAPDFNSVQFCAAIKEAQQLLPGYTYKQFCNKAAAAGCAGYIVSFSGRRALYVGRTGETHVEYFLD